MKRASKILIVGINSFLGKSIYHFLKDSNHITGIYNENIDEFKNLELIQVKELSKLDGTSFDQIYIVSAFVPREESDINTEKLFKANVELPQLLSNQFPEARIIYCSSVSVYEGLTNTLNINEETRVSPVLPYALSKLWGEAVVARHRSYGILRISSIYGIGMKENTFVPRIVQDAISHREIKIIGDGTRLQNYIHVDTLARMAISAACKERNGIFLAVGNKSYSNLEIAKLVQKFTNASLTFGGKDSSRSYTYENNYLKDMDFKTIEDGIKEYIEWKKKQY